MDKMNIICVIDSLGSGGAQRQIVELAKGFKQENHEVSFLIYHNITFFKKELDNQNIPVHVIEESNYLKRIIKLRHFIRKSKPDAVLSFLQGANVISELASLPFGSWNVVIGERSADPVIVKSFRKRMLRWLHFFADNVVSNSYENILLVKRAYPLIRSEKCHVIYNIIDSNKWAPAINFTPLSGGVFHMVVAASHISYKNSIGLVKAVNLLSDKEKQKLKISWYGKIGNDDSFDISISLVKKYKLDNIFNFHPATKNIHEVYESADAIGLFSFHEGLPNTVCEGMSMSKLILASRVSDVPIILNHNENCMFNPNDVNEISNSLSWAISLSRNELIEIGCENRKNAQLFFNKDKIVDAYLSILNK
jgi:glycosyltransferase involved in cell wall biosynthesis